MNKTTDLFVFRHGQTDWNKIKRFQGHTDVLLNETGRKQALSLHERIKRHQISVDAIVTSDLVRARETANIAFEHIDLQHVVTDQLREAHLGDTEAMLNVDILDKYGEEMFARWTSLKAADLDFAWPGGESKRQNLERVRNFLETFISENEYTRIAVSTHGGSLVRLVQFTMKNVPETIAHENCALYHLQFDGQQWEYVNKID